jgi:hypothetical protein
MFSLIGSEYFAAFLAAKIMFYSLIFVLHGLLSRDEFLTDRIFFQSIADRHLLERFVLPVAPNLWLLACSCYQPVGNINQDGDDYYT